jgi:hypothetical protein
MVRLQWGVRGALRTSQAGGVDALVTVAAGEQAGRPRRARTGPADRLDRRGEAVRDDGVILDDQDVPIRRAFK